MIIYGKNAVKEALRNNITINKMWVEKGNHDDVGEEIISLAKERRLKISFEKRDFLTHKVSTAKHQGFVADITEFVYSSTNEILELAKIYETKNPLCECGKRMKSAGSGKGYKCHKCGAKLRDGIKDVVEVKRNIKKGFYEVPPSARRHLSKPLVRMT